jgi:hypothetical protein
VTFTGLKFNVASDTSAAASMLMDLQVGGASQFSVRKNGLVIVKANLLIQTDASVLAFGISSDVILVRDAANILAQRNGVNAQAFRVYGTYTDASNYERVVLSYDSVNSRYQLKMERAGTGSSRDFFFQGGVSSGFVYSRSGSNILEFGKDGVGTYWQITTNGHFLAGTDNAYDIGAVGATRPRQVYVGTKVTTFQFEATGTVGLGKALTSTSYVSFAASTTALSTMNIAQGEAPTAPVDGDIWREDNTNTGLKIRVDGVTKTITLS